MEPNNSKYILFEKDFPRSASSRFYFLLLLAMFTMPFTIWLMLPIAICMIVNWITEWNWKEKWENLRARKALPALICLTLPYLMLIPGWLTSCNKSEATAYFDCYLWLLIAPVILLTSKPDALTKRHLHTALGLFTLSIVDHILIILCIAGYKFAQTGNPNYFYYSTFSEFLHPSYVAMYATFGFFFLLHTLKENWHVENISLRILKMGMMAILLVGVILLQSKAGVLCFLILNVIWIAHFFIKRKRYLSGILVLCLLFGGSLLLYHSGWIKKNRLMETVEQIRNHKENPYGTDSSEIRLTLWKTSKEIIRENMPWGVGTGDVKQEIKLHALEKNYTNLIRRQYNAHNQYLQSLLEIGIPGFIALLSLCLYPVYYSIRQKNLLYFSFAIMVIFNLSVECMLSVRAGVDFISLINGLLFLNTFQNHS